MFAKFTYLFYTLLFTVPLIFFLWFYFYRILRKNLIAVLTTTFILTLYGFFLWPTGLVWNTWAYNSEKILGATILGTVLEDILWWFLIAFLLASFALVMAKKEEAHEGILRR